MTIKAIGLVVILLLGMFAAPLPIDAQEPGKVYRIGFLGPDGARKSVVKRLASCVRFRRVYPFHVTIGSSSAEWLQA